MGKVTSGVFMGVITTLLVVVSFMWISGYPAFDKKEQKQEIVMSSDGLYDNYLDEKEAFQLQLELYDLPDVVVDAIIMSVTEVQDPLIIYNYPMLERYRLYWSEYTYNKEAYLKLMLRDRLGNTILSEQEDNLVDSIKLSIIPKEYKPDSVIKQIE